MKMLRGVVPLLLAVVSSQLQTAGAELPPRLLETEIAPLLAEALERNPEVAAARARVDAARARISQARALPDPTVTLSYQNEGLSPSLGSSDDAFLAISAEQMVPWPGKRRLAADVAAASELAAAAPLLRTALALEAELRRVYADLLLARELVALVEEQERTWVGIEAATRARYSVGLAEQQDVLRAQAERTRLIPMRVHEEGNVRMAVAELNGLLNRPPETPFPTPRRLTEQVPARVAAPALGDLLPHLEERSPELVGARHGQERARRELELARAGLRPDLVASASYMNRGALPAMVQGGIGFVLPLYARGKQRQAIVEAEANLRAAAAELESARLRVRVRVETNLAELVAAVAEAEPYASGVLVQDRLAVDAALANYQAGKVPFVTVLEALSTLYADRRTHADRLAHVLWHEAEIYRLEPAEMKGSR